MCTGFSKFVRDFSLPKSVRGEILGLLVATLTAVCYADPTATAARVVAPRTHWILTDLSAVSPLKPTILGSPLVQDHALAFNGAQDGLIVPMNILENLERFTIEILFRADRDGAAEQRFFHAQDMKGRRVLIELRLDEKTGEWCLDSFLYTSDLHRLALIDRTKLHRSNVWTWASLTYDGAIMTHYVDGKKEAAGRVKFGPMGPGETSLAVRLNRVFWFKGAIREVRVHDRALAADELIARATETEPSSL